MSDECDCPRCLFNRIYDKIEIENTLDPSEFAAAAAIMLLYHINTDQHEKFIGSYLLPALFHASMHFKAEIPRNTKGMH